jgi:uncharacterized protein (TIRG00374 family)
MFRRPECPGAGIGMARILSAPPSRHKPLPRRARNSRLLSFLDTPGPCGYAAERMPDSTSFASGGSIRKLLLAALALVVLGALVYRSRGVIHLHDFSWDRLGHSVRRARGSLLLLSLVSIYLTYAVRALRWVRFSRYLGRATFASVYRSTLIGFTAVFLLGRAGEPIRPLLIARKDRLPVSGTFGIYVLERLFDIASTAVIAGFALLVLPRLAIDPAVHRNFLTAARTTGLTLLAGLFAAITFFVYFRLHGAQALERRLAGWHAATGWRRSCAGLFAGFSQGLQAIRTLPDLVAAVGYSAAHWTLVALIYLWVARSFGRADPHLAQLDFPGAMLVLGFTMVGSTFQLPGVGGGAQVASFLAFTVMFGVEKEPAAAASIVLWLVTFAASSLAGVPLLISEGWSMGELRRLARAEAIAEAAGTPAIVPDAAGANPDKPVKSGEAPR